jgi:hypothetical protein
MQDDAFDALFLRENFCGFYRLAFVRLLREGLSTFRLNVPVAPKRRYMNFVGFLIHASNLAFQTQESTPLQIELIGVRRDLFSRLLTAENPRTLPPVIG